MPHKNCSNPTLLFLPQRMTLKWSQSHLLARSLVPWIWQLWKGTIQYFPVTPSPTRHTTLPDYSLATQAKLTHHLFPTLQQTSLKVCLLQESDINKEDSLCMKSATPEAECAENVRIFFKFNCLFVLLIFQIIYQGHAQHGTTFKTT